MANKEKTWEERIAHARAVNSQKKSAGVNNAPAVKTVSASSGQTKSWDDRIAHAKRVNAAKKLDEQKKLINSNEYKWASENEKRLKSGLGYNVNNGQIYSFEPITRDSLQKSIAWADSEIKKLKEGGGHSTKVGEWTDKLLTYAGYGDKKKDRISEAEEIAEASAKLRELEGQRAVYSKYLENLQVKEDVEKLDSDIYAKNKIGAIFNIDNEQKLYFLNAGEDGYDNDTYYNNSVKRDKLVKELQEMGYDDVDRYIESYAKSRNKETFAPILEYIEKGMVKHPVLGAAATTAINAVTAPIQGVGQAFDSIAEAAGIHGYSAASFPGMVSDLSKTTVHKVIDENIDNTFLNKLSKVAYNAATNIVENSFVNKTFDKLSEGVLGLNEATSTYKAGKERGLSDGQALANGIAAGIFETLFEHISLEKLRAFQASPSTTLKPFIKNVLKQSFAEGSEELFTDVANEAYDYFVNGGLSQYEQALRSGVSSKEYGQQFLAQLGETFITGALAGGGMIGMSAAPSAVSGSVSQVLTDKAVGSNIRQYGDVEKTISTAKEQGGTLGKKAAKIEKQIAEGESVSDRRIGQIDRKTTKIERAKAVDTILAGKDFKDISGKEKNAIRSSVLTLLSSGEVSYEQAEVLETENGRKALEAAQRWEIDKVLEIEAERTERKSNDIRKALDDNNTEILVKNTFSAVNAEGHKVSVGAVRSITDGEFEVVQDAETGATAKLSELKIEDRQARELYKNLQELATGENPLSVDAVNVALSMYNTLDNTSARAYSLWVHDAYKAGSVSIKNTVLSFPEFEEMFHNKYDGDIKEHQLREIYEIGARNLKVNPGVTRIGRKGLSKLQAEQVFLLHERAKQLGLEVVLTDGRLTDENGKGVNALYIEGTNRIVMSLQNDLGLTLVHAGHEIFHWGKSQNKANGEYLQNMVIGVLKSDSKYDFDGIYKQVSAEYEGISEEAILEEIAAQYLGVVFANEDSIRKTVATATAEQKSFLKKVVDYLKKFIADIKELIRLYGDSDKTVRAAVQTPVDQLQYIADTFEDVLRNTAEIKKPATETGGVKYSYAGVKAKTADINTFDYAARLEDVGKASPEEIRQQTGWFRGYDNKWRFEISDRDMQIDTRGLFSMNPDVRRYTQLVDKAYFDMTATEEEMQELVTLEKNLEGVSVEPKTLGELIQHPALFEAYPQLNDIKVYFDDIEPRGAYNSVFNAIYLQKKLKINKEQLIKTLIHEIQHAVQHIEGFAGGASASYWEDVYKEDYEALENMRDNLKLWLKDIKYFDYVNTSMQEVTSKKKTLNQHWQDIERFKKNSKYAREIESCEKAIAELEEKLPTPEALYERTAGEIEARDAALRHWRTDEARKEKRPDIDRTDVVFAEGEILSLDIKTDADGNKFVDVNPELFDARDGESHAKTIARIIKDRFNNLISVNGQQIQINKTTNDEWRRSKSANGFIKKDIQLYDDKLKAIPYADEILKAAQNWIGEAPSHIRKDDIVEFARGNIYYRVGQNGYVADVIVGIRVNGAAVLYDLRNIYSKKMTEASVTMASESPQRSAETSIADSISQSEKDVNKKYSRQLLNDTWDDIRDKMYENEVHDDIIGEIEAYIKKLTTRKLARETAVTEGLIPKYEAILKVAREYTMGSDVSAQQLADTINDLMWAAHDGNLDTKQFISTVKLIAEDIIRTGSQINDDMYREYEEFRKMTREETVYVSQQVYNQYVEEYSTRQNLNRACAGKIKIKPYDNNNRTGRALDDFYAELLERFPELFKEDVDVYHQLYEILNAWQMIQPWTEYRTDMLGINSRADLEHQSLIMAEEILSEVLGIKDTVKTIADKYSDKLKYHQEHYKEYYRKQAEEGRRRRRESENIAVINKRILRNTSRLSDMLRNETDTRHIPEGFKDAVMDFLNIIVVKNEDGRDVYHIKNGTLNMVKLGNAYASYYNPAGEDGREMTQYDEDVARWIEELAIVFGENIEIKTLSLENLSKVDNIVTHFCHIIKHENEMFVNGRNEKFTSWATGSINEMLNHIKKPEYAAEKMILDAEHGMLTPIYFFKTIGTTTKNGTVYEERLYKMFKDLQNGQDKWYRNIADTKKRLSEIKEKYHYSEDWKRATTEFTLVSGETIKLTAEEIMYMRALNIRETGHINRLCHLLEGGIIVENDGRLRKFAERKQGFEETKQARRDFEKKGSFSQDDIKEALKKNLTREDLIAIFATLTEKQEEYSEALVEMMSTTGADLGNEVSRELFGIRKFTEKNYIPISVAESFLQFSVDKKAGGNIRLKNRSFTKRTTQNANATVYVRSITDVAAEHMQEMSLYNAMTIPIENFTRVFNYQKPVQEEFDAEGNVKKTTGNSYKEIFEAVYGERGVKYFEDFLRDMNGGNQTTSRDFMSKMMSMYKKSAVTGSLSVAVQQPSALVRAMALVDPKYFVTKPYSKEDYLEMLEYCPVAGIKEIGRFDTGTGLTATEWILDENGSFADKADALLSYLPGWMDRRTWVYIWEAVKKETADKTKLKGEELLTESARRFRDVIDYTQVYDSTLSRSAYMRDKGTGAKMATAFLSEPTLSYNMVRDGLLNAKNDKKQAARSVAAFAGATLLNAMLKTLVTALRHDDEETNYFEVYLSEMPQNFFEDMIIVNSLPVVKDVISIFKGYDVNRSDMTLFSNVYNAFKVISKEGHIATWDEWFSLFGAISAFTGIPLNNVVKDFNAVIKTVTGLSKSPEFSWDVLGQTITETLLGKGDDSVKIYRAILNRNKEIADRYLIIDEKKVQEYVNQGYSEADALNKAMDNAENNFHNKVVEGLVSEDIRIKEAAEARLEADTAVYEALLEEMTGLGFDRNDVIRAVEKYISSMEDKTYESSEKKDKAVYTNSDLIRFAESFDSVKSKSVIAVFKENGKEDGDIRTTLTEVFKPQYKEAWITGNYTEIEKIRNFLVSLDVGYKESNFNKWEKEANSKE